MNIVDIVENDIKLLHIQGATNIALAIIDTLKKLPQNERNLAGKRLAYARPTEPMAQNILRYPGDLDEYKQLILNAKTEIITHGSTLITKGNSYLTHCHASSVTSVLLHNKNMDVHVYATETRPRFQGRKTVTELIDGGMHDVTMIVDSAVATIFEEQHIRAVFMGADLLTEHGFANKIGSLAISKLAALKNIPVYCFSTLLKYDPLPYTPDRIEKRNAQEIWQEHPKDLKFFSPAFDFIPYAPNIHIVCETGIISGTMVKDTTIQKYPFIFHG